MADLAKLIGCHIVRVGSVGRIVSVAKRLREHAVVQIVDAHNHQHLGDQLVWPIPPALLKEALEPSLKVAA